ncbi:hypothetical protein Acr_06g0006460 [Actinidia rufa]|uniref:CCHC-type domain-containing protein n=1 Tax=Actinidia rufa TaxID=165716 RepID=A0A7J0ER82_9ERIC|nr:hypothetical protein Acr_06g0006460 [Actinidia rufa]
MVNHLGPNVDEAPGRERDLRDIESKVVSTTRKTLTLSIVLVIAHREKRLFPVVLSKEIIMFKVERQLKEARGTSSRSWKKEGFSNKGSVSLTPKTSSIPKAAPSKSLPKQDAASSSSYPNTFNPNSRRCFKCQGLGHIASECPNRKIVSLVEEDMEEGMEKEEESSDGEQEEDGDITYGDQGQSLVARKSLSVILDDKDSWLCNNIFHTRCTSQGKVCNVIIDGGSCENMVATIMVEKLHLKTMEHPYPYKLSWLCKGRKESYA